MTNTMNFLENGNVNFGYDGEERNLNDIKSENRLFGCALASLVVLAVTMVGGFAFYVSTLPRTSSVNYIAFAVVMAVVLVAGFLGARRIAFGNGSTRKANHLIDFFLLNSVRCEWENGELMLIANRGKKEVTESLYSFLAFEFGKLGYKKVSVQKPANTKNKVRVNINALFEDEQVAVTIGNCR